MVDLDKFKEVNDGMGHLEGDLVLARVGRLLEQKCRQSNVVARYGGDEFVILMPETGIEQAQILSERLRLWVATDPMLNERHITGSFGVASFPLHGSTVEDIMRVADAGMYVSKHAGGNRVSTAEEFQEGENGRGAAPVDRVVHRRLPAARGHGSGCRRGTGRDLQKMCAGLQDDPEPMREAIMVLARAAEAREGHNTGHGQAVARYAEAIARELGLSAAGIGEIWHLRDGARCRQAGNSGADADEARAAYRRRVLHRARCTPEFRPRSWSASRNRRRCRRSFAIITSATTAPAIPMGYVERKFRWLHACSDLPMPTPQWLRTARLPRLEASKKPPVKSNAAAVRSSIPSWQGCYCTMCAASRKQQISRKTAVSDQLSAFRHKPGSQRAGIRNWLLVLSSFVSQHRPPLTTEC